MAKNNQLVEILEEQGVSQNGQSALIAAFGAPFTEAGEILANYDSIKVTSVDQVEEMQKAREKRLALRRVRIDVENKRKELKEDSLKTGRAIDAAARFVRETIEPAENYLEAQEKFKILKEEAERAERLAARVSAISKFDDPDLYKLEHMSEDVFQDLLIKLEKEAAEAAEKERMIREQEEAEAKAEAERQAKIAAENERLRKEAAEQEAASQRKLDRVNKLVQYGMTWDAESQAYVRFDQKVTADDITNLDYDKWDILYDNTVTEIQKQFDAEHRKRLAEQEAAEEQQRKEREAAEAERSKREALERAEAERNAAKEKAAAEAAEAERKALLAPDKEKITALMSQLDGFRTESMPAVKSKQAQSITNMVDEKLIELIGLIQKGVDNL